MAKVEKPRITWKKVHPDAMVPRVDKAGGVRLATKDAIDFYSGHREVLRTGIVLELPPGYRLIVDMDGVMEGRGICYCTGNGPGRIGFTIHVFYVGDFLRIQPGDVVARLVLVPVAAVELVEEVP